MVSRIMKRLDRFPFGVQNECKVITHMDGKHIVKAHQVILHSLWKTKQKQVDRPMGLAPCVPACRKDGIGAQPSGAQSGEIGAISCMEEGIGAQPRGTGACGVTSLCEKGDWSPAWWSWSLWCSIFQKGGDWSPAWQFCSLWCSILEEGWDFSPVCWTWSLWCFS